MAAPKEQVRDRFEAVVVKSLEPGERVEVSAYVVPGPSPMAVGFVGAALQASRGRGDLWMSVTDRRALFVRSTFMTQKPKDVAWADQRHAVEIAEVHADERSGWDWLVYLRPGDEPMRLNFSVVWQEEFATIIEALSSPPSAPAVEDWA